MRLTTYKNRWVDVGGELDKAKAPGTVREQQERHVREATYHDPAVPFTGPCLIKELHRPLSPDEVEERLNRATPLLSGLRWNLERTHLAVCEPLAALPFDYCRAAPSDQEPEQYDAAVIAKVGEYSIEQILVGSDEVAEPYEYLSDPTNRLRVVRALATVLTAAGTEAKVAHLDVSYRNVRVGFDPNDHRLRTYLIDWDEGLEGGPDAPPLAKEAYPNAPEILSRFEKRRWNLDGFALMRFTFWALSPGWSDRIAITRYLDDVGGESRTMDVAAARTARELIPLTRSLAAADLLSRIARAIEDIDAGVPDPATLPIAGDYLIALRAEGRARET